MRSDILRNSYAKIGDRCCPGIYNARVTRIQYIVPSIGQPLDCDRNFQLNYIIDRGFVRKNLQMGVLYILMDRTGFGLCPMVSDEKSTW